MKRSIRQRLIVLTQQDSWSVNRRILIIALLILVISFLHYFVGKENSPLHDFYRLLYFIPIIIGAFNFGYKGGIITAFISMLMYSPHIVLTLGIGVKAVNELLDVILFFTVGIITGVLSEKKNMTLMRLDGEMKRYALLENYTKNILESIKSGIIAVNNDMLITSINQGAADLLKADENCLGQNIFNVLKCCNDIKSKLLYSLEESIAIENIELVLDISKKTIINISLFPLNYENKTNGLVLIIEDITNLKRLQNQIQRNDKLASLGELSAGIAHEIRNPLAIIKAIEQTIKKELPDNNEINSELDMIDEEVERANKVVKALMEFAKPSKNQKQICFINDLIDDVLAITSNYISSRGTEVILNKCENQVVVYVDKDQIKQAFINIIFNALEAMPERGKLIITTELLEDAGGIKAIFKDTGKGIEEKDMERIFNPFFTTRDEGTGLGLSIVHKIIDEHEGSINVYSKAGEGATFELIFPKAEE